MVGKLGVATSSVMRAIFGEVVRLQLQPHRLMTPRQANLLVTGTNGLNEGHGSQLCAC